MTILSPCRMTDFEVRPNPLLQGISRGHEFVALMVKSNVADFERRERSAKNGSIDKKEDDNQDGSYSYIRFHKP